jgi:hypothetical protein
MTRRDGRSDIRVIDLRGDQRLGRIQPRGDCSGDRDERP